MFFFWIFLNNILAKTEADLIPAILNLKEKRIGRSFSRMSAEGMLPSSPQGGVYGVPRKAFPSPKWRWKYQTGNCWFNSVV